MATLIFIGLLGVFAYHCSASHKEFRGSSAMMKTVLGLCGSIGYIAHYATLIWSFWHYDWWQPIVTGIASILVGGISAILFQRNIVGMLLSPICVIVFAILSVIGLCN